MRTFDNIATESYLVADIEVVRWEQYGLGDAMPFNAMWYTVPPGSTSPPDRHPEVELSVVLSGSASVAVDDAVTVVERGGRFSSRAVRRTRFATARTRPVLVFSAYWMARDEEAAAPATEAIANG